jgi:hypoxanthine phosphoribosyltransferase
MFIIIGNLFLILLFLYYKIYVLPGLLLKHKLQYDVPSWFNKAKHFNEFKIRHKQTVGDISGFEGFVTWCAADIGYRYMLNMFFGFKNIFFYCTWSELENIVDKNIQKYDISDIDMIVGVDYGGALIAEYIKSKYNIKHIAYLRPRKQRSHNIIIFYCQVLISYFEGTFFWIYKNGLEIPYFTKMEYIEFPDISIANKKLLIVDDGILSGGTIKCCMDYVYSKLKFSDCKMIVIHGLNRKWYHNNINKVSVFQSDQLAYLPWGQT